MKNIEASRKAINALAWWLLNGWELGESGPESAVNIVMAALIEELENVN